jgi:hypothetical protein
VVDWVHGTAETIKLHGRVALSSSWGSESRTRSFCDGWREFGGMVCGANGGAVRAWQQQDRRAVEQWTGMRGDGERSGSRGVLYASR